MTTSLISTDCTVAPRVRSVIDQQLEPFNPLASTEQLGERRPADDVAQLVWAAKFTAFA
jgi:hypothetical protein